MSLNDLHPIAELRRRQQHLFQSPPRATRPLKILLYSVDSWQLGLFEQFLHLAFQLRGHSPVSVFDDGLLPLTGWENHWVKPPDREFLRQRARFIFSSLEIPAVPISRYLDGGSARRRAEELVASAKPSDLQGLVFRGIEVGRIARRDLNQYSMGLFDIETAEETAEFQRHLIHAIMSVDLANAILDSEQPQVVILVNGMLVMYSYMYEVARQRGVEVTTWEEGIYHDNAIRLAHNARAVDFAFDSRVWDQYACVPLDSESDRQIEDYFGRWRAQSATSYKYYHREQADFSSIARQLTLNPRHRLISLFTNIVWDSNALEKDDAFKGMADWVFASIDETARMPSTTLVVRAHPGEVKCRFQTRTPIRELIARRYGTLPDHVRIVDGASEISSYELARRSSICAVYTSTLGIEFTLLGLQPLICGVPYYSRRGFTNDIRSRSDYSAILGGSSKPGSSDPELAKRFMHMVIFRLLKRPEIFAGIHGSPQQPIVSIETFEGFPDSMPVFRSIVDCILERRDFVPPPGSAAPINCEKPPALKTEQLLVS